MAGPPTRRRSDDLGTEALGLLGLLSKRGVTITGQADANGNLDVVLEAPGGSHSVLGGIPADRVAAALERGWIAATEGGRLGLTSAGQQALKRARSRLTQLRAAGAPMTRSASAAKPGVNLAESPLSWLRSRHDANGQPMVTDAQFAAGERLRSELTFAHLTPRVTMAWSGVAMSGGSGGAAAGGPQDLADNVVAARSRVITALRAVGPELADILIDVCGHLKGLEVIARAEGWPSRAAKLLLQRALTALARHYGLIADIPAERRIAERLRHWGADGYRPSLAPRSGADRSD